MNFFCELNVFTRGPVLLAQLDTDDAAVLPRPEGRIAMSTDGFIVSPWKYPGGNIGRLAVCGTVNDLACMGAKPLYLTCSYIIEEGLPIEDLELIAKTMGETAREAGVNIVAGDTKVAGKGQVDKIFITTAGVGVIGEGINTSGKFTPRRHKGLSIWRRRFWKGKSYEA